MNPKHPKYIGIILGVLYGLSFRVLWDIEALHDFGGLVTISFMFLVPFAIGFIRIHFEFKLQPNISTSEIIITSWQPIFIFLLATVVTLLEGSICIAMALPAFMFFSSLGGLMAGYANRFLANRRNSTLMSVAILPILVAPVEVNFLKLTSTYTVENSITIQAPPSTVWRQLGEVELIQSNEI